jgi:hypothetical protein
MKKIMQFLSKLLPKSEADKLTIELTKTSTLSEEFIAKAIQFDSNDSKA